MSTIQEGEKAVGLERELNSQEALSEDKNDETKTTYKSFKKKYRKMRIKFDEVMRLSNELSIKEKAALETAKRLAQENDQILDMLLDVNNSAQIPADKRIDLRTITPLLTTVPALVTSEELEQAAEAKTPASQEVYNEIRKLLEEKDADEAASRPSNNKSLANLIEAIPHLTSSDPLCSRGSLASLEPLEGDASPISYLTPDQIDDYCYDLEINLGTVSAITNTSPASPHHELALRNPHSAYNWLRRNEPKIFLQDGEVSEKSNGKPGSLRGAAKRASMPVPSKADALEVVEEEGMGYDHMVGGFESTKGKRKREDDGGYHPKLGAPDGKIRKPRPKKKKVDASGDGSSAPRERKGKAKGRISGDNIVVDEPNLPSMA